MATRKTEAKPPEPSFFTILYSSFTLSKNWVEIGSNIADKDFVFIIHLGDGLSIHQPRRRWHCVSQLRVKTCRNYLFFTRDTSCQDISKENGNSLLLLQSDLVLFVLKLSRRENGDLNFLAGKGKKKMHQCKTFLFSVSVQIADIQFLQ